MKLLRNFNLLIKKYFSYVKHVLNLVCVITGFVNYEMRLLWAFVNYKGL